MFRAYLGFGILLLLFFGFQSSSPTSFEQAEEMYLKAMSNGDFSEWPKADSIFSEIIAKDQVYPSHRKIQAEVYRLFIKHPKISNKADEKTRNQDLAFIDQLLKENPNLENEQTDTYVQLLMLKSRILYHHNPVESLKNCEELIDKYKSNQNISKTTIASIYETLARNYYAQKFLNKGIHYAIKSFEYFEQSDWNFKTIAMAQYAGGGYYNVDKIDSSLYYMEIAYDLLKKTEGDDTPMLKRRSEMAFNIGVIYQGKTGDYFESEQYLKEAIHMETQAHGEKSPTLITYYSLLADTYYYIKDIEKASYYGLKAYWLADEVIKSENVYLKSLPSMTLSRIYVEKGNYEEARRLIDKVLEESINFYGINDKFTTQALIDKAFVEYKAGNFETSKKHYLMSVEAAEATGRVYSISSSYTALTNMFIDSKNYDEALHYALLDWDLINEHFAQEVKNKAKRALRLSEIYLGLKNIEQAENFLSIAENIIQKNNNTQLLELDVLNLKNMILFEKYKKSNDQSFLKDTHQNIQSIIDKIVKGKLEYNYQNSKLFYSQSVSKYIENSMEVAAELYRLQASTDLLNLIFKLMEVNKSTILLDGMTDTEVKERKGVPKDVLEKEKQLKKQLAALNRAIDRAEKDSLESNQVLKNLSDQRIELHEAIEQNQIYLKNNFPAYYQEKNLMLSENIDHYQSNTLENQQAFLEYFIGNDKIYRLFITKNRANFDVIDDLKPIEKTAEDLIQNLIEFKSTDKEAALLGNEILPEFSEKITDLIIISDKKLTQLPFEILKKEGNLLLEKFNISYAGSVQLYDVQKHLKTKRKSKLRWLGFAPTYTGNSLPNNQYEVNRINELIQGKEVVGSEATKEKFLEDAPKTAVLHLATHSEIDNINPMLSKMYFHKNDQTSGELTASEVYDLELQADLVVLSACNTGIGKNESGDGVMNMSRAFTYAGVSSTVMSLWQVPDKETSELMLLFYENLEKGQLKSEALRNAKLTYLENVNEPELKHPYYWAGFVVSGDIASLENPSFPWIYLILGLILVVIALKSFKVF